MTSRHSFRRAGVELSWLDFGGNGDILVALHGRSGCARNWVPLARALQPQWRVIALDQRGHGWSSHDMTAAATPSSPILPLSSAMCSSRPQAARSRCSAIPSVA
jgi:pimeloyl-ACP methyl ester carboxylesterase